MNTEAKYCRDSRVVRTSRVFPNDVNNHNTLFGGRLMSDIDQIASISAARHSRGDCVTASMDSVDFFARFVQLIPSVLSHMLLGQVLLLWKYL